MENIKTSENILNIILEDNIMPREEVNLHYTINGDICIFKNSKYFGFSKSGSTPKEYYKNMCIENIPVYSFPKPINKIKNYDVILLQDDLITIIEIDEDKIKGYDQYGEFKIFKIPKNLISGKQNIRCVVNDEHIISSLLLLNKNNTSYAKGNDSNKDDLIKFMLLSQSMNNKDNNMNPMMLYMLCSKESSDKDNLIKFMLLSQSMNNKDNNMNPMMLYMLMK